jgi:alpha-ketoglutarate-dependent taurine dioxygenase
MSPVRAGADVVRLWPPQTTAPPQAARFHQAVPEPAPALVRRIRNIVDQPLHVVRDVVIGMPGDATPLVAELDDFWFHTDATFLLRPPRWIAIHVLEATAGGGLEVLPADLVDAEALATRAAFPTGGSPLRAPVLETTTEGPRIRYRRDLMTPGGDDPHGLDAVHAAVGAAAPCSVHAGELKAGDCLLLDNWRILHRRRAFRGRRVIRRLWLAGEPTSL